MPRPSNATSRPRCPPDEAGASLVTATLAPRAHCSRQAATPGGRPSTLDTATSRRYLDFTPLVSPDLSLRNIMASGLCRRAETQGQERQGRIRGRPPAPAASRRYRQRPPWAVARHPGGLPLGLAALCRRQQAPGAHPALCPRVHPPLGVASSDLRTLGGASSQSVNEEGPGEPRRRPAPLRTTKQYAWVVATEPPAMPENAGTMLNVNPQNRSLRCVMAAKKGAAR